VKHTVNPTVTGSSVLGIKFDGGVMIACDTLGSYGSMARFPNISRMLRVNDTTVMGSGGDYADFQFIKSVIEQRVISDLCAGDGFQYSPLSLHSWLTRVHYNRRSKFDPLWNVTIVGGMENGEPYLGFVDKLGMAYQDTSLACGYGAYIAQPLMREAMEKAGRALTEQEAKELIHRCMTVLYYRDARSWNNYELAIVTKDRVAEIGKPLKVTGDWSIADQVKGYE
jgi:20S proteasome subunit beta 7